MHCWLMKTEPGSFSIDDLQALPDQTTVWEGVRNYQARNILRDQTTDGDQVLFYHSVTHPGIVGLAAIQGSPYPDPTQWDAHSPYYDPKSSRDKPRWFVVDVRLVRKFAVPLPLALLRTRPELAGMELLRKGSRLSVQPVSAEEFAAVLALEQELAAGAGST